LLYARRVVGHERIGPAITERGSLKLLLDSCIWPGAKKRASNGPGTKWKWVGDWNTDQAMTKSSPMQHRT